MRSKLRFPTVQSLSDEHANHSYFKHDLHIPTREFMDAERRSVKRKRVCWVGSSL